MPNAGDVQQIATSAHRIDWLLAAIGRRGWRQIVINSLIVIVDGDGEDFLGDVLTHHMTIEIFHDFLGRRRWLSLTLHRLLLHRLLRVDLAEHDKEMMTLFTLDEARRIDECLDMRTRITALWTR